MTATLTDSRERLSWPQIKERRKNDDDTNVETAVVYVLHGPVDLALYTTPEKHWMDNYMAWL